MGVKENLRDDQTNNGVFFSMAVATGWNFPDAIYKKYNKYDVEKLNDSSNVSGADAFSRLYRDVENDIEAALQKAEVTKDEKNRATTVALNAKIWRTKARLMEEVPKLQRLGTRGSGSVTNGPDP
ncbi:hypothetical protein Droror1_Dr00015092 [Drosera rotundifolia]